MKRLFNKFRSRSAYYATKLFINLTWFFKVLSIHSDSYRTFWNIKFIMWANTSDSFKIEQLNKLSPKKKEHWPGDPSICEDEHPPEFYCQEEQEKLENIYSTIPTEHSKNNDRYYRNPYNYKNPHL